MDDRNAAQNMGSDSQEWSNQAPKVVDALKRGNAVSITTWSGREVEGTICDREQAGLLLDVRRSAAGYVFLPWSSIEQVAIGEVSQRRVKFLAG